MIILFGCDYGGNYYYYVANELEDKPITVKVGSPSEGMDSVFIILPQETKLIGSEYTGVMAKHEHPEDILVYASDLGKIRIFVDDKLLDHQFQEREYWLYTTEELIGNYLLIFTEDLIK